MYYLFEKSTFVEFLSKPYLLLLCPLHAFSRSKREAQMSNDNHSSTRKANCDTPEKMVYIECMVNFQIYTCTAALRLLSSI